MLDPTFGLQIVIGAALLFAAAALHKVRDLARFADSFADYRMLPGPVARLLAPLVPCLELATSACLLWPPFRLVGLVESLGLGPLAPRALTPAELIEELLEGAPQPSAATLQKAHLDAAMAKGAPAGRGGVFCAAETTRSPQRSITVFAPTVLAE